MSYSQFSLFPVSAAKVRGAELVWAFWTQESCLSAFLLVFLHSVLNAIWFTAMVLLFATLTSMASGKGFQRWLKGVTGVVFIGFGVKLATVRASL